MTSVSVLIPAYNSAQYLRRCIDSVLNQTVLPLEIIVTDDGSTDDTAAIANSYGGIVRVISKGRNCGLPAARNFGIENAVGDWVAFLDSDDEWEPKKNEMAIACVELHKTDWCMVARKEVRDGVFTCIADPAEGDLLCVDYFSLVLQGRGCAPSSTMVKKTVFEKVGRFNEALTTGEDQEMWWRIANVFPKIGYYSKPLVRYYVDTPGSMTNSRRNDSKLIGFWEAATRISSPPGNPANAELFTRVRNAFASKAVRSYLRTGNFEAAEFVKNHVLIECDALATLLLSIPKPVARGVLLFANKLGIGRYTRSIKRRGKSLLGRPGQRITS